MEPQITMKVLQSIFGLIGTAIQFSPSGDASLTKQEELLKAYHEKLDVAVKQQAKLYKNNPQMQEIKPIKLPEKDLTEKKIIGGTACLPCSRDHFTTASAILKEATTFAKRPDHGLRSDEVMGRIGVALEQLAAMERWDLAPENIAVLEGKEKELADWAVNKSAGLRHKITAVKTIADLEKVTVEASEVKTTFMKQVWDLATTDGTIEKLCKGLSGEEKQNCITKISTLLK